MPARRVLVVDDDRKAVEMVRIYLERDGYKVLPAYDGPSALELARAARPDLIVLDLMLPGIGGLEICRALRKDSCTPIIMLTAKVREPDMLHGFDMGADDYITKPFSSKELLARIQAVLKRSRGGGGQNALSEIVCGDVRIDLARRRVLIEEREINLTPTEYNLLHELAVHPNQVLLHEHLLTKVWGAEYRDDLDYLRSYIHYLRKKIESDPANPKIIISSPGVGYMLVTPDGKGRIDSQKVDENDT